MSGGLFAKSYKTLAIPFLVILKSDTIFSHYEKLGTLFLAIIKCEVPLTPYIIENDEYFVQHSTENQRYKNNSPLSAAIKSGVSPFRHK